MKLKLQNLSILLLLFLFTQVNHLKSQNFNVILGRPTDTSITASLLFYQSAIAYLEYGTQSGQYIKSTAQTSIGASQTAEITMMSLIPSTQYYYRVRYKSPVASSFLSSPEYSFRTQRSKGESFTFTIEADEHLYDKKGVKSIYQLCLNNQAKDKPDFMISLGDIFGDDHFPTTITSEQLRVLHEDYRPFLGSICHSIPFYVCLGNHEGEMDYWIAKNPPNNLGINATLWRKYYYPNPFPNGFYSGNQDLEPYGVGNPENYYSWTWGDALFVVLDAYRDQCDTSAKPKNWEWSFGKPQYDWLKATLESSTAKYKFVFNHHTRGQGRGGVSTAKYFEWGGYNMNGTYEFDKYRPGWGKPIHQLFVDNGVDIYFQGHDHVFAHEVLDGVVYQALPMPSDSTYMIGKLANADAYISDTLDGSGHIRVSVNPECVKVDYVKVYLPQDTLSGDHKNGEIGFSYTLGTCPTGAVDQFNMNDVTLFPNPANTQIHVLFKNRVSNPEYFLYNSFGQLVKSDSKDIVDVSSIENGVYILEIRTSNSRISKKVVVNH